MKYLILFCAIYFINVQYVPAQTILTDYNQSIARAKVEKKQVLMVFSGSDWCKPCIQLKKDIFLSATFRTYMMDKLIFLELDFPYKKSNQLSKEQTKHNEELAERFNEGGSFPKVILIDPNENVLISINYKKDMRPEEFIAEIDNGIGL